MMNRWIALGIIHVLVVLIVQTVHGGRPNGAIVGVHFTENTKYRYTYTSNVESAFIGTVPSKSGLKFTCNISLDIHTAYKSVLKVDHCKIFNRLRENTESYEEFTSEFPEAVTRYPVYLTFEDNKIKSDSIHVHQNDPVYIVNVKRGILSALQLQNQPNNQQSYSQVDLFGECPVQYSVYNHKPGSIFTSRDLTLCAMPQLYQLQMRFFSVIKKLHGGYAERKTSEPIYPFGSTVNCEYRLTDTVIQSLQCVQLQSFKPTAYNGTVYATALSEIKQEFSLISTSPLDNGDSFNVPTDMRYVSILYEIPEEKEVAVSMDTLNNHLDKLVEIYDQKDMLAWPELYQDLVWLMRHTSQETLQQVLDGILSCHGNTGDACDQRSRTFKEEYLIDGLLSCATDPCLTVFTKCVKADHVSWLTSRHFLYDLAINHQPSQQTALLVLDICQQFNSIGCWLPLSIMINKVYLLSTAEEAQKKDGAIFQTILALHESLNNILRNGKEMSYTEASQVLKFLKAIKNIGSAVQVVYDTDQELLDTVLELTDSKIPYRVVKAALQVIENMAMTSRIMNKLEQLILDVTRTAIVRTLSFSILMRTDDKVIIQKLINMLHKEKMTYMRDYMVSSVKGFIENDQPDMKPRREVWEEVIRSDGRALPKLDDWMYRHTRYMELSRYFQLPFSTTFYGLQLEYDLVYDPSMHLIQSTIIRLNYYKDKKYNILEVTADNQGLEPILDAIMDSKGKGLYYFFSYLAEAKQKLEKGVNPQFADFDKKLSDALNRIVKLVNHPQFSMPEDTLTWKFFGYEVMYVEISDLISMATDALGGLLHRSSRKNGERTVNQRGQQSDQRKQKDGFIANLFMMLSKRLRVIKTRSAKVVDLTKVMPTISGASLNMTVLLTTSLGLEGSLRGDVRQYMRGAGPLVATGNLSVGLASEFFGQMLIDLGGEAQAGIRMLINVNSKVEAKNSAELEKGNKSPSTLANYTVHLTKKNIDEEYNLVQIRSRLFHLHSKWTEIPADKSLQTEVKKCTGTPFMLITGNRICGQITYPDVKHSTEHAYFPLSGPFSADVLISREDRKMEEFNMKVNFLVSNGTNDQMKSLHVSYSAPGEKLRRQINVDIDQGLDNTVAKMTMPETGAKIYYENKNIQNDKSEEHEVDVTVSKKIHFMIKNMTLFKALLQTDRAVVKEPVYDYIQSKTVIGNRTDVKTVLSLAAPSISLDINFSNLKEKLSTHFNTKFGLKYYCTKRYPVLYNLHIKPHLASTSGNVSEIYFSNDADVGYKIIEDAKLWSAQDRMLLQYPGQKITLSNEMLANLTHAHRKTIITYIGEDDKTEVIEMNAHVKNDSDEQGSHYCYEMSLEHQHRYDVDLKGHYTGSLKNKISLASDINFRRKEQLVNGDSKNVLPKEEGHSCSIYSLNKWNMKLNMTVSTKLVQSQGRPEGLEMAWDSHLHYPSCKEQHTIVSTGVIGRKMRNTPNNYKYWLNAEITTPGHDTQYNINVQAAKFQGQSMELSCLCSIPGLNFSYAYTEVCNKSGEITHKRYSYMQSPWKTLNFYLKEEGFIVKKNFFRLDHQLEAKCILGNLNLNSTITKDGIYRSYRHDGYLFVKHNVLPGRTNISITITKGVASVILSRIPATYYVDVTVKSLRVFDTVFSLKQSPSHTKDVYIYIISELFSATMMKETVTFNTDLARKVIPILNMWRHKMSAILGSTSDILHHNLNKSIPSMVVPFFNKTVSQFLKEVAEPIMSYLPLPPVVKEMVAMSLHKAKPNHGNHGDSQKQEMITKDQGIIYFGHSLLRMVMKTESLLLGYLSSALKEPPFVMEHLFLKYIKPKIEQTLKSRTISFIYPTLFQWENLSSISLTSGQQYIVGFIKSRMDFSHQQSSVNTALLYETNEVLTYDGKVYQISDRGICPYLLAADTKHAKFAVVSSNDGISVVTRKTMVTIYPGGQVFVNTCNRPVEIPFNGGDLVVTKKNVSRVITLNDGLTVSCDINTSHCNFALNGHHNQTIGLFGNNDFEIGNEFKEVSGHISSTTNDFIRQYELDLSGSCRSPSANLLHQVKVCDDLRLRCIDFFSNPDSPLAVCFNNVDSQPFMASCQERVQSCMPDSLCPAIHAYISKCDIAGVTIDPSRKLDMCDVMYPPKISEEFKALLDVVIVLYSDSDDDFCLPCIDTLIRYLHTCDKANVKLTFLQFDSKMDTVRSALEEAAKHTFRSHSQRMITLLQYNQDINSEDYKILKDIFIEGNILLNIVSRFKVLRHKGLVGLHWDGRIVSLEDILEESLDLPEDLLIRLMSDTKGSLFNAMLLEKDRKTRMEGLVKHICERQAYSSDVCN